MFSSIANDIKAQFRSGHMVTRLIFVNVGVFALIYLVKIILMLFSGGNHQVAFQKVIYYLAVHGNIGFDLLHPWVFITHMFLHVGFWHLVFNMLWLYLFGRIVGDLIGDDKPLALYILGGLSGMVFYVASSYLIGSVGSTAIGASAAVMAFAVASAMIAPDYVVNLIFIRVRLKYVVLVMLVLDLVGIANVSNTGGHFGHLGGAFFGWLYVYLMREGTDLSIPVNRIFHWISALFIPQQVSTAASRSSKHLKVEHVASVIKKERSKKGKHKSDALSEQDRIDLILDKIREKGINSLSDEEREFLNNASK